MTGVPTGTLTTGSTLVVSDLSPGTYTTTEVNPAPDFDVSSVSCDDGDSPTASSGDSGTRTAVINLDPGETVTCTFVNSKRGTAVIAGITDPEGAAGQIQFTGVPSGTIPMNGTLVVANLPPGTYTSTQVDPAPQFDLSTVSCDDGGSPLPSTGDPATRSAVFNIDPGEMVTCTFVNTRRGAAIVAVDTETSPTGISFQFTGVPTGTIPAEGTLVSADLPPGTYTTTEVDPAPDHELTEVVCDDEGSQTESLGDAQTRTAVFNIDPGETVVCTFIHGSEPPPPNGGAAGGSGGSGSGRVPPGGNPFTDPSIYLENFPIPDDLPPEAGTYALPLEGTWSVTHFAGSLNCGVTVFSIPPSPPETGLITVSEDGQEIYGEGLQDAQGATITLSANPDITGMFSGSIAGSQEGTPITIHYFMQLVVEDYIIGYLASTFTSEGLTCTVYRSFEMEYMN